MHEATFRLLEKLAPGQLEEICQRAMVLERVSALEPVGRRALAQRLKMREREVRALSESLREDGLITMTAAGMCVTELARPLLDEARSLSRNRLGIAAIETQLERILHITRVRVAAEGDLGEIGRIAAQHMRSRLKQGAILAVSGGETVRAVADAIVPGMPMDALVLPARGGFGEKVEVQADTLAEEIALRLGARHRLLHLPDGLPPRMMKEFLKMPSVSQTLDDLRQADVLVYGVGAVDKIVRERQLGDQRAAQLHRAGAKAFLLGSWYDLDGRHIAEFDEGLVLNWDFSHIPHIVAVACGEEKAEPVIAIARHHAHELLVVDAACARSMLARVRAQNPDAIL